MIKMIKMNRRGWLRVVEAFVAIMLVMSILFLQVKNIEPGVRANVLILEEAIVKEIVFNNTYKKEILSADLTGGNFDMIGKAVANYTESRLPGGVNFSVRVCSLDNNCVVNIAGKKSIYARETFVAATADTFSPRKVKLFVWEN